MRRSIVIIDAEADFVRPLASFLHARGIDAFITPDGREGLARAESVPPDAIVICVELPHVSGYSICARLKKHESLRSIPLVMTSGDRETQQGFSSHRQLRTQADEYLKKPFSGDELLQVLEPYFDLSPEPGDSDATEIGVVPPTADILRRAHPERERTTLDAAGGLLKITADLQFQSSGAPAPTPPTGARAVLALKQELSTKDREILELKERFQEEERDRVARMERETSLEQRLLQAEEERDALLGSGRATEASLADALRKIGQLERAIADIESAHEESISALQKELEASRKRAVDPPAPRRHSDHSGDATTLRAALAEKEGAIADLTRKVEVLRARNKAKEGEVSRLWDERFVALSEVRSMTDRLRDAETARDSLEKEATKQRAMVDNVWGWATSEINTLKAQIAALERELSALRSEEPRGAGMRTVEDPTGTAD